MRDFMTADEDAEEATADPAFLLVDDEDDEDDEDEEDDEDDEEEEEPPHCESGTVTGHRCDGVPTTRIHVVLPYEQGTGEKLGHGDGLGEDIDVCEDCAEMILEHEGRWAWKVD